MSTPRNTLLTKFVLVAGERAVLDEAGEVLAKRDKVEMAVQEVDLLRVAIAKVDSLETTLPQAASAEQLTKN